MSWKVLSVHCCLLYAPENPAAELLVATVIIVEADDVTARGQMEELDVISVSIIHVKASVLLKSVLAKGANLNIHFCLELLVILRAPLFFTQIQLQMLSCFFNVLYCSATSCLETRYFLITVCRLY